MLATQPPAPPQDMLERIIQIAAQSGFTAVLVVILLYFGREELQALGNRVIEQGKEFVAGLNELRHELRESRRAQDRNTKMVTIALLQLATLVPGARAQLEEINKEIEIADSKEHK